MTSVALDRWFGVRAERLDELVALHKKATGSRPGRRYGTSEFNRTLVTALVAQFQGYARDLHDLAVDEFVRTMEPDDRRDSMRRLLKQGRKLDTQTPRRSAIGSDFGRLGINLADAMAQRSAHAADRLERLDNVVELRNAIGHANEAEIERLAGEGYPATKSAFQEYRRTFNALARTLDGVLAAQLASLLDGDEPW